MLDIFDRLCLSLMIKFVSFEELIESVISQVLSRFFFREKKLINEVSSIIAYYFELLCTAAYKLVNKLIVFPLSGTQGDD